MYWGIVVGVQVDRARSNNQSFGIEHLRPIAALETANLGDLAVLDTDVGTITRQPRPVDNRAPSDDSVEFHGDLSFDPRPFLRRR